MVELKSPAEIERMHVTGQFVADVLAEFGELADVGSTSSSWNTTHAAPDPPARR